MKIVWLHRPTESGLRIPRSHSKIHWKPLHRAMNLELEEPHSWWLLSGSVTLDMNSCIKKEPGSDGKCIFKSFLKACPKDIYEKKKKIMPRDSTWIQSNDSLSLYDELSGRQRSRDRKWISETLVVVGILWIFLSWHALIHTMHVPIL